MKNQKWKLKNKICGEEVDNDISLYKGIPTKGVTSCGHQASGLYAPSCARPGRTVGGNDGVRK